MSPLHPNSSFIFLNRYHDHEICFCYNEDTLTIVDVTDKHDVQIISRTAYQGVNYTHQVLLPYSANLNKFMVMKFDTVIYMYYHYIHMFLIVQNIE